jgi:hypothetical protein
VSWPGHDNCPTPQRHGASHLYFSKQFSLISNMLFAQGDMTVGLDQMRKVARLTILNYRADASGTELLGGD